MEKKKGILRKAIQAGSAAVFALALVAGPSAPAADAQVRFELGFGQNDYRRDLGVNDIQRIARVNGYSEGFEHGLSDRRLRAGFNYRYSDEYRRALEGYRPEWGAQRVYQNAFRGGYGQGYADAYYGRNRDRDFDRAEVFRQYRYDPYYGYPSYRTSPNWQYSPDWNDDDPEGTEIIARARRMGYADGMARGQYDARIGIRRPNPTGHGAYEFALNGWQRDWGNANAYQQYYRSAFLQGYWAGYGPRR